MKMNLLQILKNSANILYAKYIKGDDLEKLPIFYIGGSQTLPPPLAPEEEEKRTIGKSKQKRERESKEGLKNG